MGLQNWTLEQRREFGHRQEVYYQMCRIEDGQDPDEDTIYNVLCPAIRATWSKREENLRRAPAHRSKDVNLEDSTQFLHDMISPFAAEV